MIIREYNLIRRVFVSVTSSFRHLQLMVMAVRTHPAPSGLPDTIDHKNNNRRHRDEYYKNSFCVDFTKRSMRRNPIWQCTVVIRKAHYGSLWTMGINLWYLYAEVERHRTPGGPQYDTEGRRRDDTSLKSTNSRPGPGFMTKIMDVKIFRFFQWANMTLTLIIKLSKLKK